jgi:hypothetical protein
MTSNETTPARRAPSEGQGIHEDGGSIRNSTANNVPLPRTTLAELGCILREEGIARANNSTDAWWRSCADAAIKYLAALDEPFSSDHMAALVPEPDHPCRWRDRFHAAVWDGVIQPVGDVLSTRPSRHRGVQRLYRGGAAR